MPSGRSGRLAPSGAVALLLAVGFAGNAAADTIHACKQKNRGPLRVVSGPGECRPSEDPISSPGRKPQAEDCECVRHA